MFIHLTSSEVFPNVFHKYCTFFSDIAWFSIWLFFFSFNINSWYCQLFPLCFPLLLAGVPDRLCIPQPASLIFILHKHVSISSPLFYVPHTQTHNKQSMWSLLLFLLFLFAKLGPKYTVCTDSDNIRHRGQCQTPLVEQTWHRIPQRPIVFMKMLR